MCVYIYICPCSAMNTVISPLAAPSTERHIVEPIPGTATLPPGALQTLCFYTSHCHYSVN